MTQREREARRRRSISLLAATAQVTFLILGQGSWAMWAFWVAQLCALTSMLFLGITFVHTSRILREEQAVPEPFGPPAPEPDRTELVEAALALVEAFALEEQGDADEAALQGSDRDAACAAFDRLAATRAAHGAHHHLMQRLGAQKRALTALRELRAAGA